VDETEITPRKMDKRGRRVLTGKVPKQGHRASGFRMGKAKGQGKLASVGKANNNFTRGEGSLRKWTFCYDEDRGWGKKERNEEKGKNNKPYS